ncbi:hypothetical protein GOP47_0000238 [Adiantum capillus-veneris]|uniref:Saccharopine dehydrogenase (NAD(+), L-glutamate-forming) n=1 Tax=Adiantum capillus-veneris TaxID=13818 RepID=A0A9D4ZQD6_ADICA|nr:hypothetical protein GOP47_0000238 [Adiantum capillus-veneris]
MNGRDTESYLGNGVLGIKRESCNKWERRAPLTPSHCAQLLHAGHRSGAHGVKRILVQPCTKRVYHDVQYENVGCEISEDLSDCGLIVGVKQPQQGTLLPDRAYAFFSHTHKAQPENMPLLDEILSKHVSLYDYERIVGDKGERLVAFGEYAGRAGMIDFLRGLGERYLSLGYSTPFLSIGSSFMYASLSAAKAAVLAAGDEIRANGLPFEISPIVFIFTGSGNVSRGAQEVFRLLPHTFVHPSQLSQLVDVASGEQSNSSFLGSKCKKGTFQVYGCIIGVEHMVAPNDPTKEFDKTSYYAHPEHYHPVFYKRIAPYASVIVNCMYWERMYPRLLTNEQLRELMSVQSEGNAGGSRLIGIADITCDIGGSIEFVNCTTSSEKPFYRYDPLQNVYSDDLSGNGVFVLATDNLPTELAKEATNHFGDALLPFLPNMVRAASLSELLRPIERACIAHKGQLTALYDYIHRMRLSNARKHLLEANAQEKSGDMYRTMISLDGHLFDQLLINEALDVIEKAGGQFRIASCELGQTVDATSHAELEVMAHSEEALSNIVDQLASIAHRSEQGKDLLNGMSSVNGSFVENIHSKSDSSTDSTSHGQIGNGVLIIGAGRMCEPAVNYLAYRGIGVTVASLYLEDAVKATTGVPNTTAVQVDVSDNAQLLSLILKVSVVISLLPPDFHIAVANCCIQAGRHLVTASYVSSEMSALHDKAQKADVSLLCEMGLDPGIDHMMAMKMIDAARLDGGQIKSFISYCGGLPSPACADNPLGYKFSWNPAGALKAGRNPAIYKEGEKIIHVPGEKLFSSAVPLRLPKLPAFALERLPNRDSLQYGDLYGISSEASTIFRATLRYEGFGDIMDSLANLGYFDREPCVSLQTNNTSHSSRPSYQALLKDLLSKFCKEKRSAVELSKVDPDTFLSLGCCKNYSSAQRVSECIRHLGLDAEEEIPVICKSPFEVLCSRMELKLTFSPKEQDMVLLHHEIEIKFGDDRRSEKHVATLLEYGDLESSSSDPFQKPHSAMARTVGLPAAMGAELLLLGKISLRGVLRPLHPEIYLPVLEVLDSCGVHIKEHVDYV